MEFGRVIDPSEVNFRLPPVDCALFGKFAKKRSDARNAPIRLYVGAPVWTAKSFIGKIYPAKTKPEEYLEIYAKCFNCIELNSTFYGVPSVERVRKWCDKVGNEFRFCPKATRSITHDADGLPRKAIQEYFHAIDNFGDNLGLVFLQFPPELGPRDWRYLQSLLGLLPKEFQISIELRHPGWFEKQKGLEWLLRLGEDYGVSIAITDTAGRRDVLHQCFPQSDTFIRFSGDGLVASDYTRLNDWCQRLKELRSRGIDEVYFILHQQQEGNCVELAEQIALLMPDAKLPAVQRVTKQEQLQLW